MYLQAFAQQRQSILAEVQEKASLLLESIQALDQGMQKSESHVLRANQHTFARIQKEFKAITHGLLPGLVSHPNESVPAQTISNKPRHVCSSHQAVLPFFSESWPLPGSATNFSFPANLNAAFSQLCDWPPFLAFGYPTMTVVSYMLDCAAFAQGSSFIQTHSCLLEK